LPALTLLLFVMNLAWIAIPTALVFVEKLASSGVWLSRASGLLLLCWGIWMAGSSLRAGEYLHRAPSRQGRGRDEDCSSPTGSPQALKALAEQDRGCGRLMTVSRIGPIISSAVVPAIGSGEVFSKGRDFAAWLGLLPRQISTGDRTILRQDLQRGNRYLRALRAGRLGRSHQAAELGEHGLHAWIWTSKKRQHHNVLAIAGHVAAQHA
jgi:hypothetical protein